MENFSEILSHHDERLHERLDQDYIKQEWNFAKEKHDIKKDMPKDIPPVNPDIRKTLVRYTLMQTLYSMNNFIASLWVTLTWPLAPL